MKSDAPGEELAKLIPKYEKWTGGETTIREVLVNLIFNAVDALPAGGRVSVRTWATAAGVHCAVSDTGVGMSPEVRRRAFEPFFTTKGVKSTGLGLSVNYGIIQRHAGELTIDTEEGRGSTRTADPGLFMPRERRR